jgi:hypothetical protein
MTTFQPCQKAILILAIKVQLKGRLALTLEVNQD